MTRQIFTAPPHDCDRDGHVVALRIRDSFDGIHLTPFCEVCRLISIGGLTLTDNLGEPILRQVEGFRFVKEMSPEAYEALFE